MSDIYSLILHHLAYSVLSTDIKPDRVWLLYKALLLT